jgi:4-hydroxy-tetrahydrodipicolinate synthase
MVAIRAVFERFPTIPALKHAQARRSGNPAWSIVRPPLCTLSQDASRELLVALEAAQSD